MRETRRCRPRFSASSEVGFTVLSMSLSLIAVFIPIVLIGGLVGRLFREFAMTIVAIVISLVVSLTTTPMMCARLLRRERDRPDGRASAQATRFEAVRNGYRRTLAVALDHPGMMMLLLAATIGLNFYVLCSRREGLRPATRHRAVRSVRSRPIKASRFN